MKAGLWKLLAPVLRKMYRRMDHLRQTDSDYVDPQSWRAIATIGEDVTLHKDAMIINAGGRDAVTLGNRCRIYGQLWTFGAGRLHVGHHSFLGAGSRVWCNSSVRIGSYVLISHLVDVHDCDSHSLRWQDRRAEIHERFDEDRDGVPPGVATAPVVIEDDVWIGFKRTIRKGVTIGRGAVVAAGSGVTRDVAQFTLVAGNPARVVKELEQ